jgi:hypothetical protein
MVSLPELNFQLREWKAQDFQVTKRATAKIRDIGSGAGTGSNRFILARDRLHEAALAGGLNHLITQVRESIDARALSDLLCTEADFAESVVVTRELLDQMASVRSPMSRLALTQLIRAFFVHFDQISQGEDLEDWCQFLKLQLKRYRLAGGESELQTYAKNADLLFQRNAPRQVVQRAMDTEIDFDTLIHRYGLTGFSDGRYLTLCRYQYYLQTLNDIDVGEAHPVLKEVCNENVINAPFSDGKLLGHAVLETLIDRTGPASISKSWQSTILSIAGDPRVPKTHPSYQKWWTMLGEKRIALMRGWLSRLDLKVFLKILEQSAKDGSNADMERMFVSRKKFMEGLLNQGHVVESRLFLSDEAVRYLNRHYRKDELPSFARVSSTKTSMIYLNIVNKVHMIEGSHSFRLKLMDKLPSTANVTDYGVNRFRDGDFRTSIALRYYREFGSRDGLLELTHDVHLNWQHRAINYLRGKRIEVETGKMIARDRLREYKQKYGSY